MIVLSFFILFLILFISLGIVFSKLKIVVNSLEFEMNGKVKAKNNYQIRVGLYLYGKLKIIGITFEEDKIKFLNFSITYKNLKQTKFFQNMIRKDAIELDKQVLKDNIKLLSMRFEKVNLNVRLGTESTLITSFLTFAISTAISFILQKGITKYNPNKHKFIITPLYENRDNIAVYLDLIASFKFVNIVKVLFELNKLSKNEHIKNKFEFKEIKIWVNIQ